MSRCERTIKVAIFTALLLGTATVVTRATAQENLRYSRPAHLVQIEGSRRINIDCRGQGTPTIILIGGLGASTRSWSQVQDAIAEVTTVCSYDRAGFGFSDPGPQPRTAFENVRDLRLLLLRARLRPPYVLVSHSAGALYADLFISQDRALVAGALFVDPAFPFQDASFAAVSPDYTGDRLRTLAHLRSCRDAARVPGQLLEADYRSCVDPPDMSLPIELQRIEQKRQYSFAYQEALTSEFENFATSSKQVQQAERSLGLLPIIVLTAGRNMSNPTMHAIWMNAHEQLSQRSRNGQHIVVIGATHAIQASQPAAVIANTTALITTIRAGETGH